MLYFFCVCVYLLTFFHEYEVLYKYVDCGTFWVEMQQFLRKIIYKQWLTLLLYLRLLQIPKSLKLEMFYL